MISTIRKSTIVENVKERLDESLAIAKVKAMVDDVFDVMRKNILDGNTLYFVGVGKISSKIKEGGRPVRNPKTGETMVMHDTVSIRLCNNTRDTIGEKLTKISFIDQIQTVQGITSEPMARIFYEELVKALKLVETGTHRMEIRGIGSFQCKKIEKRKCRNPKTGESVYKDSYLKLVFRCSKHLIKEANERHLNK